MIYLDNNATTRPHDAVVQAMHKFYTTWWANPSSVHRFGQSVRQRVELARQQLAELLHTQPAQLLWTSGGTESNNLALFGSLATAKNPAVVSDAIEHAAVREPVEALEKRGLVTQMVQVDTQGRVDVDDLIRLCRDLASRHDLIMISIQWANNETGAIQPIAALSKHLADLRQELKQAATRCRLVFHTDATQAVGKLPVDLEAVPVDLLTLAAHKFHGPKGVGALYIRRGVRLSPQIIGGPQERERRGGTENTPAIVGVGVAAELAKQFLADDSRLQSLERLRDRFEQTLCDRIEIASVNAAKASRLWNTSNVAFRRLEAEAILLGLSEKGVCASAGAACSSGSLEPSPVLLAMGIEEPVAHGSVRFSLSRETTANEIDAAIEATCQVIERLSQTLPMG